MRFRDFAAGVFFLGLLGALASRNFIKVCGRSPQSECKSELKAWFTAQRSYLQERDRYADDVVKLEYRPDSTAKAIIVWSPTAPLMHRDAGAELAKAGGLLPDGPTTTLGSTQIPVEVAGGVALGVFPKCPGCAATAICLKELDDDPQLDIWSVSTVRRLLRSGEEIPAGQPFNEQNGLR